MPGKKSNLRCFFDHVGVYMRLIGLLCASVYFLQRADVDVCVYIRVEGEKKKSTQFFSSGLIGLIDDTVRKKRARVALFASIHR